MIVVHTYAWIWCVSDPSQLGRSARRSLRAARRIGVPAICCLEVAVKAATLPAAFSGDPADRLIAAAAILESAPLITRDDRIAASGLVTTVWD